MQTIPNDDLGTAAGVSARLRTAAARNPNLKALLTIAATLIDDLVAKSAVTEKATFAVASLVSAATGEPKVELRLDGKIVHIPVSVAREIGTDVFTAAASAESDAALFAVLMEAEINPETIGQLMQSVRVARDTKEGVRT